MKASNVAIVGNKSDPVHLDGWKRISLGAGAGLLFVVGVVALLDRQKDGAASMSVLVGAMVLFLMAVVGQFPGSTWLKIDAQANRLRELNTQISSDEVFRSIADVAAMEDARVQFWARSQAFTWHAHVWSAEGRSVMIAHLRAGEALRDVVPADVWNPPRLERSILIVHDPEIAYGRIWDDLRGFADRYGYRFDDNAIRGLESEAVTEVAVCGSRFPEIHEYLTALLRGEYGGTGRPTTKVAVLSPDPEAQR